MPTEAAHAHAPEAIYPLAGKRVWVAGHRGMVGQAIVRRLAAEGCEVLTATRADVDLTRQTKVVGFEGQVAYDTPKSDGTSRELKSGDELGALGWESALILKEGVRAVYAGVKDEFGPIQGRMTAMV